MDWTSNFSDTTDSWKYQTYKIIDSGSILQRHIQTFTLGDPVVNFGSVKLTSTVLNSEIVRLLFHKIFNIDNR